MDTYDVTTYDTTSYDTTSYDATVSGCCGSTVVEPAYVDVAPAPVEPVPAEPAPAEAVEPAPLVAHSPVQAAPAPVDAAQPAPAVVDSSAQAQAPVASEPMTPQGAAQTLSEYVGGPAPVEASTSSLDDPRLVGWAQQTLNSYVGEPSQSGPFSFAPTTPEAASQMLHEYVTGAPHYNGLGSLLANPALAPQAAVLIEQQQNMANTWIRPSEQALEAAYRLGFR